MLRVDQRNRIWKLGSTDKSDGSLIISVNAVLNQLLNLFPVVNSNCIVVEGNVLEGATSQVFERLRLSNQKDNRLGGCCWCHLVIGENKA